MCQAPELPPMNQSIPSTAPIASSGGMFDPRMFSSMNAAVRRIGPRGGMFDPRIMSSIAAAKRVAPALPIPGTVPTVADVGPGGGMIDSARTISSIVATAAGKKWVPGHWE